MNAHVRSLILVITLGLACDRGAGTCDEVCSKILTITLPDGVVTAELVSDGRVIAAIDCSGLDTCKETELELPDLAAAITLRADTRSWLVTVTTPPVVEWECTHHCVKRYQGALEPMR